APQARTGASSSLRCPCPVRASATRARRRSRRCPRMVPRPPRCAVCLSHSQPGPRHASGPEDRLRVLRQESSTWRRLMSNKRVVYEGKDIDVTWNGSLCIHVGECGRANNLLFVSGRKPWCQPDDVALDEVTDVVERCPTGARSYARKDGTAHA